MTRPTRERLQFLREKLCDDTEPCIECDPQHELFSEIDALEAQAKEREITNRQVTTELVQSECKRDRLQSQLELSKHQFDIQNENIRKLQERVAKLREALQTYTFTNVPNIAHNALTADDEIK